MQKWETIFKQHAQLATAVLERKTQYNGYEPAARNKWTRRVNYIDGPVHLIA